MIVLGLLPGLVAGIKLSPLSINELDKNMVAIMKLAHKETLIHFHSF